MKEQFKFNSSINRIAWTQSNIKNAFNHLYLQGKIKRNYFIKDKKSGSRM